MTCYANVIYWRYHSFLSFSSLFQKGYIIHNPLQFLLSSLVTVYTPASCIGSLHTGALASSVLGYVLPPAIYIKTHESRLITACKQARFFGYKPDDPSAAAGTGAALAVSTAISAEEGMSIEHIGGPGARIPGTSVSSTLSTGTTAVAGATTYSSSSTTINSNCNSDRDNATTMFSVSYLNDFVRRCTLLYDFYLPFAMLAFGFVSVIIGVATVLAQAS